MAAIRLSEHQLHWLLGAGRSQREHLTKYRCGCVAVEYARGSFAVVPCAEHLAFLDMVQQDTDDQLYEARADVSWLGPRLPYWPN